MMPKPATQMLHIQRYRAVCRIFKLVKHSRSHRSVVPMGPPERSVMSKVKDIEPPTLTSSPVSNDRKLIVVDNALLKLLEQIVSVGLATSWEVRDNAPVQHEYTATKLMRKLVQKCIPAKP